MATSPTAKPRLVKAGTAQFKSQYIDPAEFDPRQIQALERKAANELLMDLTHIRVRDRTHALELWDRIFPAEAS